MEATMAIRPGRAGCFVLGIVVGAGLMSVMDSGRQSLLFTTASNASRFTDTSQASPTAMEGISTQSADLTQITEELRPLTQIPQASIRVQAVPRDVPPELLELRRVMGSLFEGRSWHSGGTCEGEDDLFLAGWEKCAAEDGLGCRLADRHPVGTPTPSPSKVPREDELFGSVTESDE
jgi:hypothetical protein